ncbi:MAG TPA: SRPBCC family protein [Gaiellaceae bacterium]
MIDAVIVTRRIDASPETVFSFFADIDRWTAWQGVDGVVECRPGGTFRVRMPGGEVASGTFVELVPLARIVFTWGWEGDGHPLPPGSTTVVVELEPDGDGTLLRLTHGPLAPPFDAPHRDGWERYLGRLAIRAEGGDPGPDLAMAEPH